MSPTRKTCGPLYREAFLKYTDGDPDKERLFAAGFVSGQAEKIFLGAYPAAMFRPSAEKLGWFGKIVVDVVRRYDLKFRHVGKEIWIYRLEHRDRISELTEMYDSEEENTPRWHGLRAELCGVPEAEIDLAFHERKGYGEPADQ